MKSNVTSKISLLGPMRPILDGVSFPQISVEDNAALTVPFTMEEIKEAVWSCEEERSPGPDGFNFTFYK